MNIDEKKRWLGWLGVAVAVIAVLAAITYWPAKETVVEPAKDAAPVVVPDTGKETAVQREKAKPPSNAESRFRAQRSKIYESLDDSEDLHPSIVARLRFLEENEESIREYESRVLEETNAAWVRVDGEGSIAFAIGRGGPGEGKSMEELMEELANIYFETFTDADTARIGWVVGGGFRGGMGFRFDQATQRAVPGARRGQAGEGQG